MVLGSPGRGAQSSYGARGLGTGSHEPIVAPGSWGAGLISVARLDVRCSQSQELWLRGTFSLAAWAWGLDCSCNSTLEGQSTTLAWLWGRKCALEIWCGFSSGTCTNRVHWQLGSQEVKHCVVVTVDSRRVALSGVSNSMRSGAVAASPQNGEAQLLVKPWGGREHQGDDSTPHRKVCLSISDLIGGSLAWGKQSTRVVCL